MKITEYFKNRRQNAIEKKQLKQQKKKDSLHVVKKAPFVALCLGGGGTRGFAHIGALKAFEEEGIDFPMVVGTSIGSVVGAMYASDKPVSEMIEYADSIDLKDIRSGFLLKAGDPKKIGNMVTAFTGDVMIEDLKKRYAAVSVDLVNGKQVILTEGSVATACSASSCVPLIFKPLIVGERHLVDGGLLNNIPSDVARMLGADRVVTIDVNPTRGGGTEETGMMDVLKATFSIMSSNASFAGIRNSDILISVNTKEFSSKSIEGKEEMIERGYIEAKKQIDEIKKLFK